MIGGTFVPFHKPSTKGDSMSITANGCAETPPKFPLGRVVATPNALCQISNEEILNALSRHVRGDWGELETEDRDTNELALKTGGRLLSSYRSLQNVKFWIITEWDRSVTTVLLPEDY
jgi:hypothetical protein